MTTSSWLVEATAAERGMAICKSWGIISQCLYSRPNLTVHGWSSAVSPPPPCVTLTVQFNSIQNILLLSSVQSEINFIIDIHTVNAMIFNSLGPGGCFTNVLRALQNILSKFVHCRNRTSYVSFKLKLCTCDQSHALGTCTKFQLEILTINVISGIVYFGEIILESSRSVSETTPRYHWYDSTSFR